MNAKELLDRIFQNMQNVSPNAPISETFAAYQENIKVLEDTLLKAYERGCADTKIKIGFYKTEKQKRQN